MVDTYSKRWEYIQIFLWSVNRWCHKLIVWKVVMVRRLIDVPTLSLCNWLITSRTFWQIQMWLISESTTWTTHFLYKWLLVGRWYIWYDTIYLRIRNTVRKQQYNYLSNNKLPCHLPVNPLDPYLQPDVKVLFLLFIGWGNKKMLWNYRIIEWWSIKTKNLFGWIFKGWWTSFASSMTNVWRVRENVFDFIIKTIPYDSILEKIRTKHYKDSGTVLRYNNNDPIELSTRKVKLKKIILVCLLFI